MTLHKNKPTNPVMRILTGLWSTISWLRRTLANIIFIVLIIVVIALIGEREPQPLPEHFALRVAPSGMLVDQLTQTAPLSMLLANDAQPSPQTRVSDLITTINKAAHDKRVSAMVLDLNNLQGGGISKLNEIGKALQGFKKTGKKITALADSYNQDQYYLASYADKIYLHNMGYVLLTGFASYRTYYKQALDKLAVNVHVFRAGKFKDAVEPYLRNDMSPASREHNSEWLNQLWGNYTHRIESARDLPVGAINDLIAREPAVLKASGGDAAKMALDTGLVDTLASRQQMRSDLIKQYGYDSQIDSYKAVNWQRYRHQEHTLAPPNTPYVGVITASGTIDNGEQPSGKIGSATLTALLRQVRHEHNIKALVIRIDSGGGNAFASEVIRAEIQATRDAGIPVVISMGSVAASGGYWMATAGDQIWATPTTITGSIGVFGVIPTFEHSLQKLGIHTDGIATTKLAGASNPLRALNPGAERAMQLNVEGTYQRFLHTVADARGLSMKAVDRIAQGRVWSGTRAKQLGLVDNLGTLTDAIKAAAEFAELKHWQVKNIAPPLSPAQQLLRQFSGLQSALGVNLASAFPTLAKLESSLSHFTQPLTELANSQQQGIYARCMGCRLVTQ